MSRYKGPGAGIGLFFKQAKREGAGAKSARGQVARDGHQSDGGCLGGHCNDPDFYLERDGATVRALDGEETQPSVYSSKFTLPAMLRTDH